MASDRQDADRHVPLRLLGLLGRGRDDVEADVGEEHQRRAGEDPADAERAGREAHVLQQGRRVVTPSARLGDPDGGMNGDVVAGVDEEQPGDDHQQHDADLDRRPSRS